MLTSAIITAGGFGSRMESATPKQFLQLAGKPLLHHSLAPFQACPNISDIIVTLPAEHVAQFGVDYWHEQGFSKLRQVLAGGLTRQESVYQGLLAVNAKANTVVIHDGARCLLSQDVLDRVLSALAEWDGAIAALPVRDTLKHCQDERIAHTVAREHLWAMQTPQAFRYPFILQAYQHAKKQGLVATDDAQVAEHFGGRLRVVQASAHNIKVTLAEDLILAEALLRATNKS